MSLFQQSIELPFADPFLKLYPHHALAAGILQNNEHILPLLLTDYVQMVIMCTVLWILIISGHIRNVIICIICCMIWLYTDMIKKHGNIMWRTALWMENIKER